MDNIAALIRRFTMANRELMVELVSDMVRIRSYPGEEDEIQRYLQFRLSHLGLETRLRKVDPERLKKYRAYSDDGVAYDRRYNLVGIKKGKDPYCKKKVAPGMNSPRSLILNGHVDVVPPGDLSCWHDDPLSGKVENGKVFGRGSLDMKGGLAVGITALKVLKDIGFNNNGDIIFASVCGEESGGCGALALVEDGVRADGCIILEPTRLKISAIQSGCHTFRITIRGRSIHACMAYKGINVIEKFYIIYEALKRLDRLRHERFKSKYAPYYEETGNVAPLSVGTINAGEWPSTVPDRLEACGRMGIFPEESVEEMHNEFEEAVEETAKADPWLLHNRPIVEWYEGLFEPAATEPENDLVKTLASSHLEMLNSEAQFEAVTYGSDMRIFKLYAGIPTVMYGPGDVSRAHSVNEHLEIDGALDAVRTIAMMVVKWCGGEIS